MSIKVPLGGILLRFHLRKSYGGQESFGGYGREPFILLMLRARHSGNPPAGGASRIRGSR